MYMQSRGANLMERESYVHKAIILEKKGRRKKKTNMTRKKSDERFKD